MSIVDTPVVRTVPQLGDSMVTTAQMTLSRKIGCGCRITMRNPDGDGDSDVVLGLNLTQQIVDWSDPQSALDWSDSMALVGSFGSIECAQGGRLMRALTGIDIGDNIGDNLSNNIMADDARWPWLQAALVGRLAGTPFSGVDRLVRASDASNASIASITADTCTLRVSLWSGKHAFFTHARASAKVWLAFLSHSAWTREMRAVSAFRDSPCHTTISIARHTLPSHALRTLTAGDIVLPDNPQFSSHGEGILQWGGLTARVRYQAPGALTITAVEGSMEYQETHEAMAEFAETPQNIPETQDMQQDDLASLDMVPMTLDFTLGQVRMLLGEVRTLGVGTILPLSGGSPASIAIMSGGRALGRGEVVDVNGQLGIRIVQLFNGA